VAKFPAIPKQSMPEIECTVSMPKILDPRGTGRSRVNNIQRESISHGMKEALIKHHTKRVPGHFNHWRQKKYNYMTRSEETRQRKEQLTGAADLVRSKRTKQRVTSRIDIKRPKKNKFGILVTGKSRMKSDMRERAGARGVTREVMKDEITRWTKEEEASAAGDFAEAYKKKLLSKLTTRQIVRLEALGSPGLAQLF